MHMNILKPNVIYNSSIYAHTSAQNRSTRRYEVRPMQYCMTVNMRMDLHPVKAHQEDGNTNQIPGTHFTWAPGIPAHLDYTTVLQEHILSSVNNN